MQVLTVTGHRPPRLGLGYAPHELAKLYNFARAMLAKHARPLFTPRSVVVTGMAQGWDQAIAQGCVDLGLAFHAYLPFDGHGSLWPAEARDRYAQLLSRAAAVHTVSVEHTRDAFHARDASMIHAAAVARGRVMALFDGQYKGGTSVTVTMANQRLLPVLNVWDEWLAWRSA